MPTYPIALKKEAAAAWLATGSSRKAGKLVSVPSRTIRNWQNADWWDDALEEVQKQFTQEVKGRLNKVVLTALDQLQDRVNNGDTSAAGHKIPMKGKDLALVAGISVDKLRLIEGKPGRIVRNEGVMKFLAEHSRPVERESILPTIEPDDTD